MEDLEEAVEEAEEEAVEEVVEEDTGEDEKDLDEINFKNYKYYSLKLKK